MSNRPTLQHLIDTEHPDATIIIPVNAQGDLGKVLELLEDISQYDGSDRFQVLLVVNNFNNDEPPKEYLQQYEALGVQTLAVPQLDGHRGIPPALRARMLALPLARSRACLFFDADCRIPNATACLSWYCEVFREEAVMLAYTRVGHYNWPNHRPGMRLWLAVHYGWRWLKRNCMRVPTPRGSSYAMDRDFKQHLFNDGYLADETAIGRLVQAFRKKSVYTGKRQRQILTDGRMYENASVWRLFTSYALRRLRINLTSLVVRNDAASHTGREHDQAHEYDETGRCIRTAD